MRHRQTSGTGTSGAWPACIMFLLTATGGILTVAFGQPRGVWAGYTAATAAALVGTGALWRQRHLFERRARETARDRRADQAAVAAAQRQSRENVAWLRVELEHEQQYAVLVREQLTRAREQLEEERRARLAAEREADALDRWRAGAGSAAAPRGAAETPLIEHDAAPGRTRVPAHAAPHAAAHRTQRHLAQIPELPGEDESAGRLYRPFVDLDTAAPVSEAALAMAPRIAPRSADDVLDLTAYDETLEFSLRELRKDLA